MPAIAAAPRRAPNAATAPPVRPTAANATAISVGTFNVHNIYDAADDPMYNDDVVTPAVYRFRLRKTNAAIAALGAPDILGVEEVENQHVVDDLLKQPALKGYQAVFMQGNDLWQHNDALFYKPSKVTLGAVSAPNPQVLLPDGQTSVDPRLLFSSPPVVADFTLTGARQASAGATHLTVVLNHMKSKVGGPKYDPRRLRQGQFVGSIVDAQVKRDPASAVIVMGDLNAGGADPQFQAIMHRANGTPRMVDTSDRLAPDQRFTYSYKGQNDQLDHVLVDARHAATVTGVQIPHFDTQPDPAKIADPTAADGSSDHDAVVAQFALGAARSR